MFVILCGLWYVVVLCGWFGCFGLFVLGVLTTLYLDWRSAGFGRLLFVLVACCGFLGFVDCLFGDLVCVLMFCCDLGAFNCCRFGLVSVNSVDCGAA